MHNVTTRRGLSLLVDVVKVGGMKKSDAIVLAYKIGRLNSIPSRVIREVLSMLDKLV